MRTIVSAAALLCALLTGGPAWAVDLSSVRCENLELIKIMEDKIKSARVEGGNGLASYGAYPDRIVKSTTSHASQNKLICRISVRLTVRGDAQTLRGTYTFQQFSSGKLTATWNMQQ